MNRHCVFLSSLCVSDVVSLSLRFSLSSLSYLSGVSKGRFRPCFLIKVAKKVLDFRFILLTEQCIKELVRQQKQSHRRCH